MFNANTPMRLTGCAGKQVKDGKERRRVLVLSFQLQPFTPEMAEDLHIKSRLFSSRSGEPLPDVLTTTLAISNPLQRVQIRSAPDVPQATVTLQDAEIAPKITVRKDKEGPVYSATLVVVADYPSGDNLLYLMQRVTEQFFVTLESEQGDMLARDHKSRLVEAEEDDDVGPVAEEASATH